MTDQKSQHTPGPWLKSGCIVLSNDEDRGMRFAIAERVRGRNAEDQEANARLISAAPELLKVLKTIEDDFKKYGCCRANMSDGEFTQDYTTRRELVEAAIAKAEGRGE
jgi:hypothetical protein